eukprot:4570816-Prymnesium_polylepis.1
MLRIPTYLVYEFLCHVQAQRRGREETARPMRLGLVLRGEAVAQRVDAQLRDAARRGRWRLRA